MASSAARPTGLDRICVIIGRTRHKMMVAELREAAKLGAQLIELRLDFLSRAVDFKRLWPEKKCPWVATIRRRDDGGRWSLPEAERMMMIRQAIVGGFEYIDLETDIADGIRRFGSVKRIVSYHNMLETPANLAEIHARMCNQDADIVKISVMAQSPMDIQSVLNLIKNAKKPTVAHCMGEIGFPSRLLSLKYGSPFVYAAFNKERGIAPGLPSMEELTRIYPMGTINSATKVFGVLGDPVGHSLSPVLHNTMYKHMGIDALYLPFRVPRNHLQAALESFEQIPVDGYSVTIPHKEMVVGYAQDRDPLVAKTSAANTLVRRGDRWFAANSDYTGALEALQTAAPKTDDGQTLPWAECSAMLLGAGGAAKAVAHALRQLGVSVAVASRTKDRAEALAREASCRAIDWVARHNGEYQILINCTPIGMHPAVDESPVHASSLKPGMVVFDTVYNPENTMLVKEARDRGCQVVTGVEMFVRQAAKQFHYFTGKTPALEHLREITRRALSPVRYDRLLDADADTDGEEEVTTSDED